MVQAQRISCQNSAWVSLSFAASSPPYATPFTHSFPITQSAIIDLASFPIKAGGAFVPMVDVTGDSRSSPPPAPEPVTFTMNGRTANYEVDGNIWNWTVKFTTLDAPSGRPLIPKFPPDVPLNALPYSNWDQQVKQAGVLTCAPRTADDVVAVCNWAKDAGYFVRPLGVAHGWSPLTLPTAPLPDAKVVLVDLTKSIWQASFSAASGGLPDRVTVGAGATMLDLLEFLEAQPGGHGAASGFSFPHVPAPGNLTVGGVLAIDAHGTAVPTPPNDDFAASYGSMSNHVLGLTAVCTDPAGDGTYKLKTFSRDDPDAAALLVHLGRCLVVGATLQVVDNYNLRCQSRTDLPASTVFAAPKADGSDPADSFGDFLAKTGRIEVIWFPFSANPWVHLWEVASQKPPASLPAAGPYNYPFADHVPDALQTFIDQILQGIPSITPEFGRMAASITSYGLDGKGALGQSGQYPISRDIWGASKNTLLYIQDTTLRVTANGYAVHLKRSGVQQAVHDFTAKFSELLNSYATKGQYPVNSAMEIRVTGLDDPSRVKMPPPNLIKTPTISALSEDSTDLANKWDVAVWFDVLSIPGTPHSNEFYTELEGWLLTRFSATAGRVVPEWSKGWAYTANGPWTSSAFLTHIRQTFTEGRPEDATWTHEAATLAGYDKAGLFWAPLSQQLFGS
jgi:Cholesterol oxidase, substrate-binding/FAD binding domain